jgi:hypothetical protein
MVTVTERLIKIDGESLPFSTSHNPVSGLCILGYTNFSTLLSIVGRLYVFGDLLNFWYLVFPNDWRLAVTIWLMFSWMMQYPLASSWKKKIFRNWKVSYLDLRDAIPKRSTWIKVSHQDSKMIVGTWDLPDWKPLTLEDQTFRRLTSLGTLLLSWKFNARHESRSGGIPKLKNFLSCLARCDKINCPE